MLDVVRSTVSSNTDVAEALLRDIDNDSDRSETDISSAGVTLVFGDNRDGGGAAAQFQVGVQLFLFEDDVVCSISSEGPINFMEDVGSLACG